MSTAWKVAYADFVTALMAFFLLMWVLNMAPPETKAGLASYFQEEALLQGNSASPISNNTLINQTDKLDLRNSPQNEEERVNQAIMQRLRTTITADNMPRGTTGLNSDDIGIQLRVNSDVMFTPGSAELSEQGQRIMADVRAVLEDYNVYLVVRGHADSAEAEGSPYPSPWELSAARAAAAVRSLQEQGVRPTRMRAVAYGDTRPLEPGKSEESLARNRRVEFHFHRPDSMTSSIVY